MRGIIFMLLLLSLLLLVVGGAVALLRQRRAENQKLVANGQPSSSWDFLDPVVEYLPVSAGSSVISSLLLGLLGLEPMLRWAGAAAALPSLLVLLQYVYVLAHRPGEASDSNEIESQRRRAHKAVESAYGARTLFIRYGFPAIVLLVEGLVLVFALVKPQRFIDLPHGQLAVGAAYGAMGAYTWVMLELGRRGFRHDITGGLALWSIVTLALGPILAAVLAFVWTLKPSDTWQPAVVLFYAGYAPRTVLTAVTSAAGQLLRVGPSPHVETRTTPLTKIRGINAQIEERLAEEGIDNVETLATAEPIRLLRDTPFDLRAILWWIDEALLMMYLPQRWQLLQEQGITGAIDLADLAKKVHASNGPGPETIAQPNAATVAGGEAGASDADVPAPSALCSPEAVLKAIAEKLSLGDAEFCALIERIRQDSQVQYIWWLYNVYVSDGDKAAEGDKTDHSSAKGTSESASLPPPGQAH